MGGKNLDLAFCLLVGATGVSVNLGTGVWICSGNYFHLDNFVYHSLSCIKSCCCLCGVLFFTSSFYSEQNIIIWY